MNKRIFFALISAMVTLGMIQTDILSSSFAIQEDGGKSVEMFVDFEFDPTSYDYSYIGQTFCFELTKLGDPLCLKKGT